MKFRLLRLRLIIFFVLGCLLWVSRVHAYSFEDLLFSLNLREQVQFVLFEAAPTRAGRGDVAPAYVNARNLRRMGYRGRIVITLPGDHDSAVLEELSSDYRLANVNSQEAMVKVEDGIEVLRSYGPFNPVTLPNPDLAFRFALRPSEIYKGQQIRGAKLSFHFGVNGLNEIPGNEWSKNKLVLADGQSIFIPQVGFKAENIGAYFNQYAHEVGALESSSALHALIKRLTLDRENYLAAVEKKASARTQKLAERNQELIRYLENSAPGFLKKNVMATLYGAGDPSGWPDVIDYFESLPEDRGAILWSPSIFGEESIQRLTEMSKAQLSHGKRLVFVKTSDPESLSKAVPAGEIRVVLTDNFPHATYLHLSSISNFPNLVAGDNAVSDMVSMGKPFVMTTVDWNVPSMNGLRKFLLSGQSAKSSEFNSAARDVIEDVFTPKKVGRLRNSAKLMDSKFIRLFRESSKKLNSDDVLKTSFLLGKQLEQYSGGVSEITPERWLALKKAGSVDPDPRLNRMAQWMEDEQTLNITDLYKSGVFDSELDPVLSAKNRAVFSLPYFWVPVSDGGVEIVQSSSVPEALHDFYFQERSGKKYFRFLSHPSAYDMYAKEFGRRGIAVTAEKSSLVFVPGASERSGWLFDRANPSKNFQFVKVSIPKEINKTVRTVRAVEVNRSVLISDLVKQSNQIKKSSTMSFLQEPMGAFVQRDGYNLGGFLVRDVDPNLKKPERLMGVMSFLGEDSVTGEPFFFRFLSEADRKDPWPWFEKNIVNPAAAIITDWHVNRGLIFEMHSQNLMIEFDPISKTPQFRFIYRDMGGALPDLKQAMKNKIDLPMPTREQEFRKLYHLQYSENLQTATVEKFLKKQVTDLFAIQFKKYGLVSAERREEIKILAENRLKKAIFPVSSVGTELKSWSELGAEFEKRIFRSMTSGEGFVRTQGRFFGSGEEGSMFFGDATADQAKWSIKAKSGPWKQLTWILDAQERVIGYRYLGCGDALLPPQSGRLAQ